MYYYYVDNYCHNKSVRSVPFRICLFPHPKKNLRRRWVNCGCDTLTLTLALALTFTYAHPRFSRRLPLPVSEIFQPTSEIIWDTFTLEVPRWLYDYFSLGVFYILTCCVWFVYDL